MVCEYRPGNDDPTRTRITIAGGHILVPFDVSTRTGSFELVKLMINSLLSRHNAQFSAIDIKKFYMDTPMENCEYVRVKLEDIPHEFIEEYHLLENKRHGWVYFEVFRGCYGLLQSVKLANNPLRTKLEDAHYYETATTPGLWRHKWRSIQFVLIVDDFGNEYVRNQDADHLASVLKNHHDISQDWEHKQFTCIELDWNYETKYCDRTCRLSMKMYSKHLLVKLNNSMPRKPQLFSHKIRKVKYGSKTQLSHKDEKIQASQ